MTKFTNQSLLFPTTSDGTLKIMQYENFKEPLSENSFNKDLAVSEFKDVKRIVKHRYRHLASKQVREYIIANYLTDHRNIILLELILYIEWASSTVERGFSITNRMLVQSRKLLSKTRLNNLLMLRVNVQVLSLASSI